MNEFISVSLLMKVITREKDLLLVEDLEGNQYNFHGSVLNTLVSSEQTEGDIKTCSKSELVSIICENRERVLQVTFINKAQILLTRSIRGGWVDSLGYIVANDLEKEFNKENAFIKIDTRHLVSAIICKTKYNTK